MDEPIARVSSRRLLVALGVTVVVVPMLVFGWFGFDSSGSSDAPDSITDVADDADDLAGAEEAPPASAPPPPPPSRKARFEEGQAAWADLDPGACHHRTIAFETVVRVTNISTGASTTCVVSERGPYVADRIIEVDRSVFAELAPGTDDSVVTVRIEW